MSFLINGSIRVVLLDIEGTTTPVEFVYNTLFGYARENLRRFLVEHLDNSSVQDILDGLAAQRNEDSTEGKNPPPWLSTNEEERIESTVRYVLWLMESDSKLPLLKSLQGLIWEEGYSNGLLKGEVFPDVPEALESWHSLGKQICIYSSGSVLGQKLLFESTKYGDLTRYIDGFFDTSVGRKTDMESYVNISKSKGIPEKEFLFFSDITRELDAARASGMQTCLVSRGEYPLDKPSEHTMIHSFRETNTLFA